MFIQFERLPRLAEVAGARVFDLPWPDSFAAARNASLRHANGTWLLWLDADRQHLMALYRSLGRQCEAESRERAQRVVQQKETVRIEKRGADSVYY